VPAVPRRDPHRFVKDLRLRAAAADAKALRRLAGYSARWRPADRVLTDAGRAANRSALWMLVAAALAGTGAERGRRSAVHGLASIAVASAAVNGPLKFAARRPRPLADHRAARSEIAMPGSFSFPSGHAASATAFAVGVGRQWPLVAAPVGLAAATVAYSRVHTGVHYPSDVLVGAAVGAIAARTAELLLTQPWRGRAGHAGAVANSVPRQAVLLISPDAGSADDLDRARSVMRSAAFTVVDEIPVDERERLAEWVRRADGERPLIVAAGGDGTVGAAADLVADSPAVLGVLPLGTSNDFARSLGIPIDPAAAARLLATGKVSTIDAGLVSAGDGPQRHFVHAAAAGLNVHFARHATRAAMRRRFGRLTYIVAAARTLRERRTFACTVQIDGERHDLKLVHLSVINAPVFGGALELRLVGADVDDRALDVIAVEHVPALRLVLAALAMLIHPHRPGRGIHLFQGRNIQIHTSEPLEITLDGEIAGTLPATFDVAPEALRVITPVDFADTDDSAVSARPAAGHAG
jgi:undecaprenyl-diphosphatase